MNHPPPALLLALLAAVAPAAGCKDTNKAPPTGEPRVPTPIPTPPFAHVRGVSSAASVAAVPGDLPFRDCDASYRAWPAEASGGPASSVYCYARPAEASCLALLSPALPRVLGLRGGPQGTCVFAEDQAHPDPDPVTHQPRCCYVTWQGTMGRPLLVDLAPRRAPLASRRAPLAASWWCQ